MLKFEYFLGGWGSVTTFYFKAVACVLKRIYHIARRKLVATVLGDSELIGQGGALHSVFC